MSFEVFENISYQNLSKFFSLTKEGYKNTSDIKLNYSTTYVDLFILKLISYPLYLFLIALFSSLIMFNIKQIKGSSFKILVGLFFSVIIYYLNNFSYVLGSIEKISLILSIFLPLLILATINSLMLYRINEK